MTVNELMSALEGYLRANPDCGDAIVLVSMDDGQPHDALAPVVGATGHGRETGDPMFTIDVD